MNEFIRSDIEGLKPTREVSDTPTGRMWAIDRDKHQLYTEMVQIMEAGPGGMSKEEFEGKLNEILDVLIDLDHRQLEAFQDAVAQQFVGDGA